MTLDGHWLEREAIRHLTRGESTRQRVAKTIERRLRARGERTGEDVERLAAEIPALVERLAERGYVDDDRYAKQLVERGRRDGRSSADISMRLENAGVSAEALRSIERDRPESGEELRRQADSTGSTDATDATGIEEAASRMDPELAAAFRTAQKRRLGPYRHDADERAARRQRDLGILARRGFSQDVAYQVIDAAAPPEPSHPRAGNRGFGS